jgi:hypothetical protein
MSRSRKKIPIVSAWAVNHGAVKKWRRAERQRFRARERTYLKQEQYEKLPRKREYNLHNEWGSPRDGKNYWIKPIRTGLWYDGVYYFGTGEEWEKCMRK